MKLAIIGSGPLAIFCAQHFDQLGAEVVLFQKNALGGNIRFLLGHFPKMEIQFEGHSKTLEECWNEFMVPAISNLEEQGITKAGEVLRVHKRFLHPNETVPDKSRMHDLFRVIYSVNPKESILKQLEENPDMFKQLGEQVMNSLHLPVESFEDFDIVIEARGRGKAALPMGPSNALALNENNIRMSSPLFYEKDIFTQFSIEGKKHIVLVGNNESAILTLLKFKDWIFNNPAHTLSWVTYSPAKTLHQNHWVNTELIALLDLSEAEFQKDKILFETKMHDWRDLEDYVKVKIPKPIEPQAKIKIYEGYDVTSVDRLLDREGVFATLETPDFRLHSKPEDLITLPTEAILVGCGVEDEVTFAKGIGPDEPGYYKLESDNINDGLMMIKSIEQKILSFFSRAQ